MDETFTQISLKERQMEKDTSYFGRVFGLIAKLNYAPKYPPSTLTRLSLSFFCLIKILNVPTPSELP